MRVSVLFQIKQRFWPLGFSFFSSLLLPSETGFLQFLMLSCVPLPSLVSWHEDRSMRSWPGRPQVVVVTLFSINCFLTAHAAHTGFHTMVNSGGDSSRLL